MVQMSQEFVLEPFSQLLDAIAARWTPAPSP
jgi:hypothetical protein